MKTILLMRHAKACDGRAGMTDFQRMLTDDGRTAAIQTGTRLKSLALRIDRVIASSSVRTKETASFLSTEVCPDAPLVLLDELYLGNADSFASAARKQPLEDDSSVLIIGHNPGIAALICEWAGEDLSVPTATVAVFQSSANRWSEIRSNAESIPKLVCMIQDGEIVRQEPEFTASVVP